MATILNRLIDMLPSRVKHRLDPERYFQSDPWMCKPTEEWNSPAFWDRHYEDLLSDPKNADRRDRIQYRRANQILNMCCFLAKWPLCKVLCAGCGIAAEPQLFAWMGFQVAAVDASSAAIRWSESQKWTVEELARTIEIWEKLDPDGHSYRVVPDPERARSILRERHREGGTVVYRVADWASLDGGFDLVYCHNGLRASKKPYWDLTLRNFYRLLAPGGVLAVVTLNAIAIEAEINSLARRAGYDLVRPDYTPDPSPLPVNELSGARKHFLGYWPTG